MMIKDGWHDISERISVYTEGGRVRKVIKNNLPAMVYKWDKKLRVWTNECGCLYDTFKKGYREGRYAIK